MGRRLGLWNNNNALLWMYILDNYSCFNRKSSGLWYITDLLDALNICTLKNHNCEINKKTRSLMHRINPSRRKSAQGRCGTTSTSSPAKQLTGLESRMAQNAYLPWHQAALMQTVRCSIIIVFFLIITMRVICEFQIKSRFA